MHSQVKEVAGGMQEVFESLKKILEPYAHGLLLQSSETGYSINCRKEVKKGMPMFFGGVNIGKNYVSYYLMPVYVYPDLLNGISNELKKKMQGKSCFNFKKIDEQLFEELKALTNEGHAAFVKGGWIE
jgi:hypothetical protein